MWGAVITSAAAIAVVLYMEGPIVALALTAVSSAALLIVLRASEAKAQPVRSQPRQLEVIDGTKDSEMEFPALRRQAL